MGRNVEIVTQDDQKQRWKAFVEEHSRYDSLSDFMRTAAENEVARQKGSVPEGDVNAEVVGTLNRVEGMLTELTSIGVIEGSLASVDHSLQSRGPELESIINRGDQELEELVGELWEAMDFFTKVRQQSHDRGVDVIAVQDEPVFQKQVIQAKCLNLSKGVNADDIRTYASIRQQENADISIVVTTSFFTDQAQEVANELNVKMVDGPTLCWLLDAQGMLPN